MDANGLLSVIALLVAGYTLLSEGKRLDINLRMSWADWTFLGLLTAIILAIIYSPVILALKIAPPIKWHWGFNEQTTIFTCLILMLIFVVVKIRSNTIPTANYSKWTKISETLLREKKLPELGFLFNKHHLQLFSILSHTPWYVRAHNFISPKHLILLAQLEQKKPPRLHSLRSLLCRLFPSEGSKQKTISRSISLILKSRLFVSYLAETYPMVAARATLLRFRDNDEFDNSFFVYLISHSSSPLYRELRDNQNCSYTGEYFLDESNALLNFYLKDIKVAQHISLWKPIADFVLQFIRENKGNQNFYNQPNNNFSEGEARWSCPIFVSTLLFEVMISAAIFQRLNFHMWLMYVDSFTKEILESLDHHPSVDKDREFPSKYDYLLYNLFSACDNWVKAVEHLDFTPPSLGDRKEFPEFWAAKTLGAMLRKILTSEKILDHQKLYFLEMTVQRMEKLDSCGFSDYSELILNNCVLEYEGGKVDHLFLYMLNDLYARSDYISKSVQSTFESGIAKFMKE